MFGRPRYTAVEGDNPSNETDTSNNRTGSSSPAIRPTDGVFVNIPSSDDEIPLSPPPQLSPVPQNNLTANVPHYILSGKNDIEPPAYHQIFHDNQVTVNAAADDDELLIDGLPVGNMPILVVNAMLSATFDVVGFLLAALLATSHAARAGARIGLSITLFRYGFYVRSKQADEDVLAYKYYEAQDLGTPEQVHSENQFIGHILLMFSFLIFMHATVDYWRVIRLQKMLQPATSSSSSSSA